MVQMGGVKGFTLMEVLVATAICGIALGVALSGLSQGHRAVERAMLMRDAGLALRLAMMDLSSSEKQARLKEGAEIEEEIKGLAGWRYEVVVKALEVQVEEEGNSTEGVHQGGTDAKEAVEVQGLREIPLRLTGPDGRSFSMVSWR